MLHAPPTPILWCGGKVLGGEIFPGAQRRQPDRTLSARIGSGIPGGARLRLVGAYAPRKELWRLPIFKAHWSSDPWAFYFAHKQKKRTKRTIRLTQRDAFRGLSLQHIGKGCGGDNVGSPDAFEAEEFPVAGDEVVGMSFFRERDQVIVHCVGYEREGFFRCDECSMFLEFEQHVLHHRAPDGVFPGKMRIRENADQLFHDIT